MWPSSGLERKREGRSWSSHPGPWGGSTYRQIVKGSGMPEGCGAAILALPPVLNFHVTEVQVFLL